MDRTASLSSGTNFRGANNFRYLSSYPFDGSLIRGMKIKFVLNRLMLSFFELTTY